MFASWNPDQPEITDLIVQHDALSLERLPVRKAEVLAVFSKFRNQLAMRAVRALPERDGILDAVQIDRHLLMVHWEMQRLAEEFSHGRRVWELLRPVIASLRKSGFDGIIRIVDVGCGIGYTLRWLAANLPVDQFGISLTGVDLNSTLIAEANRLSKLENLRCHFLHGDAFSSANSAHIFLSTGLIHHFRGEALVEFLRRHEQSETQSFLHFDFHPWILAPYGSSFFHYIRMRTKIARHDGVLSAARAHRAHTLVNSARQAETKFAVGIYGAHIWNTPFPRVFHTLLGIRRPLLSELKRQLGNRVSRLGQLS